MEECVGGKRMHTVPPPLTPPLNEKDGINGADDKLTILHQQERGNNLTNNITTVMNSPRSRKFACPAIIRARIQSAAVNERAVKSKAVSLVP
jgi:hypothetical protein